MGELSPTHRFLAPPVTSGQDSEAAWLSCNQCVDLCANGRMTSSVKLPMRK